MYYENHSGNNGANNYAINKQNLDGFKTAGFSFAAGFLGFLNPVTLGIAALSFGPRIYDNMKRTEFEMEKRAEEHYKNTQTFYDARINHRYVFKRPATESEWVEIGRRYLNEDGGTILRSMGLI